jgi:pseudouridine-5'-phosphate glycosidase
MMSSTELGLQSGILLAVPIPASEAASGGQLEAAIQTALAEADKKGIAGREITPYILSRHSIISPLQYYSIIPVLADPFF